MAPPQGERFFAVEQFDGLRERFASAAPFPHVVLDGFVDDAAVARLCEALEDEDADAMVHAIYEMDGTADRFEHPDLHAFVAELGDEAVRDRVRELSGEASDAVTMRGYAYRAGHFLLPHADSDADERRRVAFVLYLACSDDLEGGELELFRVETDGEEVTATVPTKRIAPKPGRLVLFSVGPHSLHQVLEVRRGLRVSLAGWFVRS